MPKYKFSEIAYNINQKKIPEPGDEAMYIGLEHLDSGSLKVSRWGSDVPITGEKLVMKKGDILFGRRNTYLRRAAIAPHDGIFSAHGMIFRPNTDVIDEKYFPFFISSDYFMNAAIRISVGSLSPTVNWKTLKDLEFDIPDLESQRKSAELLTSANELKEAYEILLEQTDELVKSQFIEMFGDLNDNPKGWQLRKFSEVAKVDGTMTKDYEAYANFPHIGIDSIEKNTGTLSGYRTVKEDNVISPKYYFCSKHILYSKIRPALNKVAIPDFEGLCSADCYPILTINGWCERKFLAHIMRTDFFLRYILSYSGRSQMPKVNRKQLEGFTFPCPPIELQKEFLKVIEQSDKSKYYIQMGKKRIDKEKNICLMKTILNN